MRIGDGDQIHALSSQKIPSAQGMRKKKHRKK